MALPCYTIDIVGYLATLLLQCVIVGHEVENYQ